MVETKSSVAQSRCWRALRVAIVLAAGACVGFAGIRALGRYLAPATVPSGPIAPVASVPRTGLPRLGPRCGHSGAESTRARSTDPALHAAVAEITASIEAVASWLEADRDSRFRVRIGSGIRPDVPLPKRLLPTLAITDGMLVETRTGSLSVRESARIELAYDVPLSGWDSAAGAWRPASLTRHVVSGADAVLVDELRKIWISSTPAEVPDQCNSLSVREELLRQVRDCILALEDASSIAKHVQEGDEGVEFVVDFDPFSCVLIDTLPIVARVQITIGLGDPVPPRLIVKAMRAPDDSGNEEVCARLVLQRVGEWFVVERQVSNNVIEFSIGPAVPAGALVDAPPDQWPSLLRAAGYKRPNQ